MKETRYRMMVYVLGGIAILWLLLDWLALLSFVSDLLMSPKAVDYFGVSVANLLGIVTGPVGFMMSILTLATGIVTYQHHETLSETVYEGLFTTGVAFDLLSRREEQVRGCIVYDGARWKASYLPDGTVRIDGRQCPTCTVDLEPAHLPSTALTDTEQEGVANERRTIFAGLIRDSGRETSSNEAESFVEALACPRCSFAVRGHQDDERGHGEVEKAFRKHFEQMRHGGENPFESWRYHASERVDNDPSPGDLWDEYVLESSTSNLKHVNLIESTEVDGDNANHAPAGKYPALYDLQASASEIERVIDALPEPFDVAVNWLVKSDYLERRDRLREKREQTANELTRRVLRLQRQLGVKVEQAVLDYEYGRKPSTDVDTLLDVTSEGRETLITLRDELDYDFLTNSEQRRLSMVVETLSETERFLVETIRFEEQWADIASKIEAFEERYEPYTDGKRYMITEDQGMLTSMGTRIMGEISALGRDVDLDYIPDASATRLHEQQVRFRELEQIIPRYNNATPDEDGFTGFVEQQMDVYEELLQTSYGPLNQNQQRAVVTNDRFNLVDASAGTGKTLTLTYRFLYLYERGIPIDDIVAITFTGEAATEMRERIGDELPGINEDDLNICTIHALAREFVMDSMIDPPGDDWDHDTARNKYIDGFVDGDAWVRDKYPALYDEYESQRDLFFKVSETYRKGHQYDDESDEDFIRRKLRKFIQCARAFGLSGDMIRNREDLGEERQVTYRFSLVGSAVLEAYEDIVADSNEMADFDDMIDTAATLIEGNPSVYANDYQHVLVDEFQDVTDRELAFIQSLRKACDARLFCVGDDWQSIFGFRGSDITHFTEFTQQHTSVAKTTLDVNYRCPPAIVDAGAKLMAQSRAEQNTKDVEPNRDLDTQPELHTLDGELYPAHLPAVTANLIENAHDEGHDWSDIMLLSRNNENGQYIEAIRKELRARDVPHTTPRNDEPDYVGDGDPDDLVQSQSVHASKGTEAPVVILAHAAEHMPGGLPAEERVDEALQGAVDSRADYYSEERRLFYVALTRTEERFAAVCPRGRISRYIRDIEPVFDIVEHELAELTGAITSFESRDGYYRGTLDCVSLQRELEFCVYKSDFDDMDALTAVRRCLETADNVQLTGVENAFDTKYPWEFKIVPDSNVQELIAPRTAQD